MKRLALLLAFVLVLTLGMTASAHAANPPGTYKLTIQVYWDADSDGMWDAYEPVLPNSWIVLQDVYTGAYYLPDPITNACGRAAVYLPVGSKWYGYVLAVLKPLPPPWAGGQIWKAEAAPAKSDLAADRGVARVTMNGNRCMGFGISPEFPSLCYPDCPPPDCPPEPPAPCCCPK